MAALPDLPRKKSKLFQSGSAILFAAARCMKYKSRHAMKAGCPIILAGMAGLVVIALNAVLLELLRRFSSP